MHAMTNQPFSILRTEMPNTSLQAGEGVIPEINPLALLSVLADFVQLKDPAMLTLEVSRLSSQYPDIR